MCGRFAQPLRLRGVEVRQPPVSAVARQPPLPQRGREGRRGQQPPCTRVIVRDAHPEPPEELLSLVDGLRLHRDRHPGPRAEGHPERVGQCEQ